jgi:hypothetical protein
VTYFKDLSPYVYFTRDEPSKASPLNIGWLGSKVPFEKGVTSQAFRDKLLKFCADEYIVLIALGFHACEFCGMDMGDWYETQKEKYDKAQCASIGNGEIRVQGKSAVYAAPALIYHYVVKHDYKPPDEFIEAILAGEPDSKEQTELLKNYPK